jgi:outer membrane protein assembly factor BamB
LSRAVLSIVLALAGGVAAADWPQWRGPSRDGVAGVSAPRTWPAALTRAWSVPVGLGHAAPVVVGARVFVFAREGEDEVLRALDLGTGREVWKQSYPAPYRMNPAAAGHGPGPKSTPVVAGGRVFTLGIGGILSAHDAEGGLLLWRKHPGQFPSPAPKFGAAQSPVVDGGRVIVHWGGSEGGALAAFDVATGALRWQWTEDLPAYASPVVADTRLVGLDAEAGRLLWSVPITTSYEQNSVTPLVIGDRVVFSGLDHPLRAVRIARAGAGWQALPAWENEDVPLYMSTPVAAGGRVFGFTHRRKGQLFAVDAATGATVWTSDARLGENASLAVAGPVVLALLDGGELVAFEASAARFQPLHRSTVASSATWAHVALVDGGLLVKDVNAVTHLRY